MSPSTNGPATNEIVELPLRGEGWVAVRSPGDQIPSHGTDMLGQRYAYDLLRVDGRRGEHYHPGGAFGGLVGFPTRQCYTWGAPIYSPFDSEIVEAVDDVPERSRVRPVLEPIRAARNAATFTRSRLPSVMGNHVIARAGGVFAAFAHLAPESVTVAPGQTVGTGDLIGRVGHTGNSTSPHLHFQLMDSADPMTAQGVPCAFRSYEVRRAGTWLRVENGVPSRTDRIRAANTSSR